MMRGTVGVADTSLFIAGGVGRPLRGEPPGELAVSVVTIAELRVGVLVAGDAASRARRLTTLHGAESLEPLPIDDAVATAWAELRIALRDSGRRMPVNDSWIAATALAYGYPVVAHDADYDSVPGLTVVRL